MPISIYGAIAGDTNPVTMLVNVNRRVGPPVLFTNVCGCALFARGVTTNGPFMTNYNMRITLSFRLPIFEIQGQDIALWRSIWSTRHILLHFVQRQDWHEPVMVVACHNGSSMSCDGRLLVVCHSEYVAVHPPMVDWSILMCNQCVCMHLFHLYLDCVVYNKNGNVCVLPWYKFCVYGKSIPLIS
jgi:hypothetical protein